MSQQRIRLPELPVFKRYSLALRQEYASPEEFLAVLERTANRVRGIINEAARTAEPEPEAVLIGGDEDFDHTAFAPSLDEEPGSLFGPGEDELAPETHTQEGDQPTRIDGAGARTSSAAKTTSGRKSKPQPKRKKPSPRIVRVGESGEPLEEARAARAAQSRTAKPRSKGKKATAARRK